MADSKARIEISEELTRQVANLARLELTEAEVKTFTHQLGDILRFVEQLQTLDVSDVEPLMHPLESLGSLREDEVIPCPAIAEGGYRVPQIL